MSTHYNESATLGKPQRLARLLSIVRHAQGRGPEVPLNSQLETVLYRLASGKGHLVSLPQLQQGPHGTFVSDLQARIHDLRKIGFRIDSDSHMVGGKRRSTYLLRLTPDGNPDMKGSAISPPAMLARKPAQPAQEAMFDTRLFADFEMGRRR